jgi:signal transduction histidine kinase
MTESFLAEGGEMGALVRATDWAKTPLGPVSSWSPVLRTMVGFLLRNRFPLLLWWGHEFVQIYNDAYTPILGVKHPHRALGKPVAECWNEIWHIIKPMIETPFRGGPATWSDDLFLLLRRKDFTEETHFKVAYSPVPDESAPGGIGGVLATVAEITEEVYGRRQLATLGALAEQAAGARTSEAACESAARTMEGNARDLPCAAFYLLDGKGAARRVASAGFGESDVLPARIALDDESDPWAIARVAGAREAEIVDVSARDLPRGAWDEAPSRALVLPLASPDTAQPYGVLVVALSPHRALDDGYRIFVTLAADHVTSAIRNTRLYQQERERAEKLAEIDRAKTAFFSSVSHEFRTPLTLMLGPVEDAIASPDGALQGPDLATVQRNALRLLKLVNSLLDFARIEAGRVEASYAATDLATATRDLTSAFQSAFDRAGLTLDASGIVALAEPAYVDRDMWEKIVLNLLSNALKFTFEGRVAVSLRAVGDDLELAVADSGIGIPSEEMPRLFERFHRVRGARSRTHEGSGIGLALVQELTRMHGGTVHAQSRLGEGTTFFVRIRRGRDHIAPERIDARPLLASTSLGPIPFVEEAMRWLPEEPPPSTPIPPSGRPSAAGAAPPGGRPRILVADDNADMRDYLTRLLSARYDVLAVRDGAEALRSATAHPPDLIVSDVMMPNLDGFELVRALRAEPRTRTTPIVLLSARAGDEAATEGLSTGADDYVVKPFSARTLVARIDGQLARGRLRNELVAAKREAESASRAKDEFLAMLGHELRNPLAPIVTALELMDLRDVAPRERAIIDRQVRHLMRLVDDLLDVSRIARGKIHIDRQTVDVASVVADAFETAMPALEQSGHQLSVDVLRGTYFVKGDRSRLAQVVANLLTNAARYTEQRGAIDVHAGAEGGTIVVRVRDTGRGIAPDLLPRVFDLFEQGPREIDRAQGGLGLGLAIVKNLVVLHGGTVAAESAGHGKGSTFTVRLPACEAPAGDPLPAPLKLGALPIPTGRRVLIVDDNEDGAEMLDEALRSMGHSTRVAYDGPAAIEAASAFKPDVALIDIGLPVMDGYAVARRLREILDGSPVLIAVTGYGQESDRARAREAGFDQHLVKPVEIARLTELLEFPPSACPA